VAARFVYWDCGFKAKTATMKRSDMLRLFTNWQWGDEIKDQQTGWKCSTQRRQGNMQQNFNGTSDENPPSRSRHADVIILKWTLKIKYKA
jgi:hypothetical protein